MIRFICQAQRGVVLVEVLLAVVLISILGMQCLSMVAPVWKGIEDSREETAAVLAARSILEMVSIDPSICPEYGEWKVSECLPWEHPYTITLKRTIYTEWEGLDQVTVVVAAEDRIWAQLSTLIQTERS